MFGKLREDGSLEVFSKLPYISNPTDEMIIKAGWSPVFDPEVCPEKNLQFYHLEYSYDIQEKEVMNEVISYEPHTEMREVLVFPHEPNYVELGGDGFEPVRETREVTINTRVVTLVPGIATIQVIKSKWVANELQECKDNATDAVQSSLDSILATRSVIDSSLGFKTVFDTAAQINIMGILVAKDSMTWPIAFIDADNNVHMLSFEEIAALAQDLMTYKNSLYIKATEYRTQITQANTVEELPNTSEFFMDASSID